NSQNIRFRNLHVYSDCKASFDNAVYDQTHDIQIRQREISALTISGEDTPAAPKETSSVVATGTKVKKLAGGFFNISGAAVDKNGQLYFVDAHWQHIFRWSPARHLEAVGDSPIDPVNLAFDKAGNLMIVSYAGDGTVYSLRFDEPGSKLTLLTPVPSSPHAGATFVLPLTYWRNENDFVEAVPVARPYQYISPDGTTILNAGEDFV